MSFEARVGRWLEALGLPRAALLVALVGALVYANSLGNGFAYDDVHAILNNTAIQSLSTLPGALVTPYWPIAEGQELALWRPITTGLFGLQYAIGGGGALVFHATNVLLHALVSGLVVVFLAALMPLAMAVLAGLIFAVHPVHTEAVANVVGLAEVVSAAAVIAACIVHLRSGERSRWGPSLGIGLLYALAFGAKESAVTLPGLIFLIDAARGRLGWAELSGYLARRWRVYFTMLVVAIGMLTARIEILGGTLIPRAPGGAELLLEIPRIWTLGEIWTHYVRLWAFPLDLSADYSPNVIPISFGWHATNLVGVGLALTILLGTLLAWRRSPVGEDVRTPRLVALGVLWFVIAISPVSNTLFITGVLLAERTLYLPSVGLAAATAWAAFMAWRHRPRVTTVVVVAFVLFGTARTWTRNPTWRNTQTVFYTLMGDYPHSGRSQWLLGDSHIQGGRPADAMRAYRAAVQLLDSPYGLITHVARILMELDRFDSADRLLDRAIRDAPGLAPAYRMRAGLRAEMGDAPGAERYARAALALSEGRDVQREHVLAWALASRGAWEEATRVRERAEELGLVRAWQRWVYDALVARRMGHDAAAGAALDSALVRVETRVGRAALDSIRVNEFGLAPSSIPDASEPDPAGDSLPPGGDS